MAFKSKSAARFFDEIKILRARHNRKRFVLSDNILDMRYLKDLFPLLESDSEGFEFYYETKSNLRRDQIDAMSKAGLIYIQAGIESLSTNILKIMGKGTTLLQNLQTLKWCKEAGIGVAWNFLYGFPGEEAEDYTEIVKLIPSIVHLPPPVGSGQIRMDRFSPYWLHPEQFGLTNIKQAKGYDYIYPELAAAERMRLAYFFEFDYPDGKNTKNYFWDAQGAVFRWQHAGKTRSSPTSAMKKAVTRKRPIF